MEPVPLFIVREDASVEALGFWHHEARTLELVAKGTPFLGPGRHVIEGALTPRASRFRPTSRRSCTRSMR